jgi:hypothetical protein
MSALRDQLFAKAEKPLLTPITFCGMDCFIRQWDEGERIQWESFVKGMKSEGADELSGEQNSSVARHAIVASLADESGELIFHEGDDDRLLSFPANEIASAFDRIVGQQTAEPVDAKKNSTTTQD